MPPIVKSSLFYVFLLGVCAIMYFGPQITPIIYGICIFLYAMSVLNSSFKLITGIEIFLKKMTKTRPQAFIFGFGTCTLMQSSGLVSVLAISFLSAGLITLTAGLAIIFGANLGCLTGAWLVAAVGLKIDIAAYAAPMIIIGIISTYSKQKGLKGFGYFIFSIGLLFMGIAFMKSGFDSIKDTIDLSQYAMSGVTGLLVYFLIGIIITVIMQSSHATITLAITALAASQISYENSLAIVIGSNIGSCVMAVIGSFSANIEGKKLTVAHVIFNTTTAVLMLILINPFIALTDMIANASNIANDDYTLKLAIFNSIFQIVGVMIFYPLTGYMAKMLNKYIIAKKERSKIATALYLNDEALRFSDTAYRVLVQEMSHLFNNTLSILAKSISISKADIDSEESVGEIIAKRNKAMEIDFNELYNNRFKSLYNEIIEFNIDATAICEQKDMPKFMDARRVTLILAEVLKIMSNVQPNFYRFMNSSNEYAKGAYNKLRGKLLYTLRIINDNASYESEEEFLSRDLQGEITALNELIMILENEELRLDVLLRDRKISGTIATSLMNDTAQIKSIVSSLANMVIMLKTYQDIDIEKMALQTKKENEENEEKNTQEDEKKVS